MWSSYLLLILPLASAASIKLTKRRLSDPLLSRRQLPPSQKDHSRPHRSTRVRGVTRNDKRMAPANDPIAPGQASTIYTTVQTIVYVQPTGTTSDTSQAAAQAETIYTTVQVLVTVAAADGGAESTRVNALEGVSSSSTESSSVAETSTSLTGGMTTTAAVEPTETGTTSATSSATTNIGSPGETGMPKVGNLILGEAAPWVYTVDMKIGPEGKVVPMLLDTGSSSFWAADTSCVNCKTNGMVGALVSDPKHCMEYKAEYGTGHFAGCLVTTDIEFGPYKIKEIGMASAVTMADELAAHGESFSGMFGLAMSDRVGTTTPMSRLLSDGLVTDPWVGVRLQRAGEGDSELIFGDALKSLHGVPAFHVTMLARPEGKPRYNITLDHLSILGTAVSDSYINGRGVILDSGTSNIVVPDARYLAILAMLSENKVIRANPVYGKSSMLRCDALAGADEALVFTFGGVKFPVPWKDIVGPKINLTGTTYDTVGAPTYCEPRIQTIGTNDWILGDSFLVNVYHAINTQTGDVQLWRLKQAL